MGYFVRKSNKGFRVVEQTWTPERKEQVVPREAYHSLGFRFDMSLEEARNRAKQINLQNQIEVKKKVAVAKRVADQKEINKAYLPEHIVAAFEEDLKDYYQDNEERLENLLKQWNIVKKMLSAIAIDPKDFYLERNKFFNYYREKAWGSNYIKKLNRLTNLWGHFYSRKTNSFFQAIPKLSGIQISKIQDVREKKLKEAKLTGKKSNMKTPADPLLWNDLKNVKSSFENSSLTLHWNWMFIGLWFGLRPIEIDSLKESKNYKIYEDSGVEVISVYQSKLRHLPIEKRWKDIPIYTKQQKEAIQLIKMKAFKRPLNKTLGRFFNNKIETYSPRKGFTDLMLSLGFALEDISQFLGHTSIDMTWKHYKNKKSFKLPKQEAS